MVEVTIVNIVISDIITEEITGVPMVAVGVIMIFPARTRGRYSSRIVKEPFEAREIDTLRLLRL